MKVAASSGLARALACSWPAALVGARSLATAAPQRQPEPAQVSALKLHKKEKVLEVVFASGVTRRFSAELLRVCSPSAENCSTGGNVKVPAGRRQVGIMGLELVGNYAVRISFDDLHNTGLYTWDFLHELGQARFSRAKAYIVALRQQGLSRDPRKAPLTQRSAG